MMQQDQKEFFIGCFYIVMYAVAAAVAFFTASCLWNYVLRF